MTMNEERTGFRTQFENLAWGWQVCSEQIENLKQAQNTLLRCLTELMRSHGIDAQVFYTDDYKIEVTCRPGTDYLKTDIQRELAEILTPEQVETVLTALKPPPARPVSIPAVKKFIKQTGRDDVQAVLSHYTRVNHDSPAKVKVTKK